MELVKFTWLHVYEKYSVWYVGERTRKVRSGYRGYD